MTVRVRLPEPLRAFADGERDIAVEGASTVRAVFARLAETHPGVRHRVLTETGDVRPHVNVYVGDENIRYLKGLDSPVRDGDTVFVLPAVSGGQ
ncbi:MAG: MoaD/ThiS family protein [Deltaproteobacteria bacterium]|nr:MoaD/ThiS family protein [Deltaproteobacteria bacterium]